MPPRFDIKTSRHEDTVIVSPQGELDVATVPELEARITAVCEERPSDLLLDLGGLTFMDSTGVYTLMTAKIRCEAQGCRFGVVPGPPAVQLLLDVTGVAGELEFRARPPSGE